MNAWIECLLPNAHCPLPIAHCLWLPDALGQRNRCNDGSRCAQCLGDQDCPTREVKIFCVLYLLFKEERILYFLFELLVQWGEDYFVFCISSSYWRKLRIFSYFVFLIQGGEDFLYFVFVFLFQGCEDLFVFWKCICYPRVAGESISEFCTIIKFQLV